MCNIRFNMIDWLVEIIIFTLPISQLPSQQCETNTLK